MFSEQSRPSLPAWFSSWMRPVGIIIGAVLLLVAGYYLFDLLFDRFLGIPITIILLAILLTYLLRPIVERMVSFSKAKYLHFSRVVAVLVLYAAIGWGIYGVGAVTATTLSRDLADLRVTWAHARQEAPRQFNRVVVWYQIRVPKNLQVEINASVQKELKTFVPRVVPRLFGVAQVAIKWLGLLIELIFVPLVAFYLLTDGSRVREQLLGFVPSRFRERVVLYATGMDGILRRYVIGQLLLCAIAWAVVTAAMLLLGVKGALLLGIIAGVSRAIPVIGPLVGGVPVLAAVLVTAQNDADRLLPGAFWWVLAGFTLLHLFESKVLMPRILGDQLGLHPVLVIISLLLGYELMGLLGMFLAPPVLAMIRFILIEHERRKEPPYPAPDPAPATDPVPNPGPA